MSKIQLPSSFKGNHTTALSAALTYLEGLESGQVDTSIFADNAVVTFPYAASIGWGSVLNGIQQIQELFGKLGHLFKDWKIHLTEVHTSTDVNTVTFEFKASAIAVPTSKTYDQLYIAVLTVNDQGKVAVLREYWNPKIVVDVMPPQPQH